MKTFYFTELAINESVDWNSSFLVKKELTPNFTEINHCRLRSGEFFRALLIYSSSLVLFTWSRENLR